MSYSQVNIADVDDMAPQFGLEGQESRFVRKPLGADAIGMAHYRLEPNRSFAFGHRHKTMEEMYVVLSGTGRFRIDDDVIEVGPQDVVYVQPQAWRNWASGPDGLELLAFGSHAEGDDESEMDEDFPVGGS